jgi:hypothetical protein
MSYPTPPATQIQPPPPTPKKRPGWVRWALLAVGVVVLLGLGSAIGASTKKTEAAAAPVVTTATVTAEVTVTADPVTAAPVTVTNAAAAVEPVTVTALAPEAVTVTAPAPATAAAPAAGGGSSGPFVDGTYLVGTDIQAGNYKCAGATSDSRWIIEDAAGETLDIDFSAVARVPANGYTVQFKDCPNQWEKVG